MIAKYKGINVAWFVVNQNSECALIVYFKVTFVCNGKAYRKYGFSDSRDGYVAIILLIL